MRLLSSNNCFWDKLASNGSYGNKYLNQMILTLQKLSQQPIFFVLLTNKNLFINL